MLNQTIGVSLPPGAFRRATLLAMALLLGSAQAPPAPQPGRAGEARPAATAESAPPRLPPDKATWHELTLGAAGSVRTLRFTATVGAFRLTGGGDGGGATAAPQADLAWTAYVLDAPGGDGERRRALRPVAFLVNGGPGAASAWLQLGAVGPWRVPVDTRASSGPGTGPTLSPSAPPVLAGNEETWLDFADLVFLDPPGTGWSRALNEDGRKRAWSVGGDISMLAEAVHRWLEANDRLASPKLVVGESYGGFRGPRLVRALQSEQGVGVAGLVLLSPVLDFGGAAETYDPMQYVVRLPSMVAAVRGTADRAALADAEAYATGEYLHDLWRGEGDREAVERASRRVAALLAPGGIDPALVRHRAGRMDVGTFLRELRRDEGRVVSIYDAGIGSADPFPAAPFSSAPEPILEPLRTVLTSAAYMLYGGRLGWLPDGKYELLNDRVNRAWNWGRGRTAPESYGALRRALALDPRFRVMVVHGAADLITPYMASKLILDQIPALGPPNRAELKVYAGGHMFYLDDASRAAFRRDAATLVAAIGPAADAGGTAAATPPGAAPAGNAAAAGTPPPPAQQPPAAGTPSAPAVR